MSNFSHQLAEIVANIQIDRNFNVCHPDYPSLELPQEAIDKIHQLSPQLQTKYLIVRVQNYLHDLYFTHSSMSLAEANTADQQPSPVKNNLVDGVDIDFHRRLWQSNSSRGYLDRGWQVITTTTEGELIVVKDGLHLHIDPLQHLPLDVRQAQSGDVVPIYLPPNLVGRDTFIIVGNCGTPATAHGLGSGDRSVQIYFNFTPEAAVAIAARVTSQLNELSLPFQFAILHDPALFHRYDGGTLWLSQSNYLAFQADLAQIYRSHQTEFATDISLFTKQLAPGLGLAEVPTTGTFGLQRCEILATALVMANDRGQTTVADKLAAVTKRFAAAQIDLRQPYLNSTEIDRYNPIVV